LGAACADLSSRFHVDQSNVYLIISRKHWKHI
jgi:hypothetical protein